MTRPELPSNRSFGFTFTVVFALLAAFLWWRQLPGQMAMLAAAALMFVATLAAPDRLMPLNALWMRFGNLLHSIVNPLVTGVMYFLAVTPMGIVIRLSGRDALRRKLDPDAPTYWQTREDADEVRKGFTRQF